MGYNDEQSSIQQKRPPLPDCQRCQKKASAFTYMPLRSGQRRYLCGHCYLLEQTTLFSRPGFLLPL